MKQAIINLYPFKELSAETQKKVLNDMSDINVMDNWWDYIYEDAANVGLKISSFDLEKKEADLAFIESVLEVADLILKNHGENTDTYKVASLYKIAELTIEDEDSENLDNLFEIKLKEAYLAMLESAFKDATNEPQIIATIEANEYLFTESGQLAEVEWYKTAQEVSTVIPDPELPLFYYQELDEENERVLIESVPVQEYYGIVSEAEGGIIAYAIGEEHAELIRAALLQHSVKEGDMFEVKQKTFMAKDISGRGFVGEILLSDILSGWDDESGYDSDTLFVWALGCDVGDFWQTNNLHITCLKRS